jgi:alkanesulfonate monooxygenase SsuD/methylene tetrahydromethanopterin reductase-like flavin-dependent oxidoreductase (luciferase family)
MLDSHVGKADVVVEAEALGFERAWFCDSQMIWSDPYVAMTLAAERTSRIRIGTGVTHPGTRIAPVTANAIACINALAPGRTFLGLATGHTSMRMIGQPPAAIAALEDYVRVVRALLAGEPVEYAHGKHSAEIQFLQLDRRYINLDVRIPIYLGANGPRALRLAGEAADGWIAAAMTAEAAGAGFRQLSEAAAGVGRALPSDYVACNTISACVLRPGDKLTDRRIVDQTGSMVTANLHFAYEIWLQAGEPDSLIPAHFADIWDEYVARVDAFSLPRRARFRQIHEGHATYLVEEERRFVTPEGIRASVVIGSPTEIVEQIEAMAAAGINEIALIPPADFQREIFRDFAEYVMPHFR